MHTKALTSLTTLFFMMGLITCLNDILVPYLKVIFELNYAQASLVQFAFFAAYGIISLPTSYLIQRIGYHKGIVLGFTIAAIGCCFFYPAVNQHTYGLFLLALFILAIGIVILQVAANPYVSVVGPKERAPSRLTLAQAFNSFGTFLAPFFGSYFILTRLDETGNAEGVQNLYLIVAGVLIVLGIILAILPLPEIKRPVLQKIRWRDLLRKKEIFMGMIGIFTYVGAEVTIGTFLINYIVETTPTSEIGAATIVGLYWGCAMLGRLLGSKTLKHFRAGDVLTFHGIGAVGLILISINSRGMTSIYSMALVGLANSIIFPVIFTLAIRNLETGEESKASGLLVTAMIGGAVVPLLTGQLADVTGLRTAFLLPTICYIFVAFLGFRNR